MIHVFLMQAKYNLKMNQQLYQACQQLSDEQIKQDRGAFFGSLFNTLNHLIIADSYWLYKCCGDKSKVALLDGAGKPVAIKSVNDVLTDDFSILWRWRRQLDENIVEFIEGLSERDIAQEINHTTADGVETRYSLTKVLTHFFNHQTHHRGQATTLLSQMNVDYGCTDLLVFDV